MIIKKIANGQKCELQIDDNPSFIPDEILQVGNEYSQNEVRGMTGICYKSPSSMIAILDYEMDGLRSRNFYQKGMWKRGTDGLPKFHVYKLLSVENARKKRESSMVY